MTDYNEDDDYRPKTVKEAVNRYLDICDSSNLEILIESPKTYMEFLCSNLEKEVIEICEIINNLSLLGSCGSANMPVEEAAHIIIKAIWEDLHK